MNWAVKKCYQTTEKKDWYFYQSIIRFLYFSIIPWRNEQGRPCHSTALHCVSMKTCSRRNIIITTRSKEELRAASPFASVSSLLLVHFLSVVSTNGRMGRREGVKSFKGLCSGDSGTQYFPVIKIYCYGILSHVLCSRSLLPERVMAILVILTEKESLFSSL